MLRQLPELDPLIGQAWVFVGDDEGTLVRQQHGEANMSTYVRLVREMIQGGITRDRAIQYVVKSFGLSATTAEAITMKTEG
jgi:hypothetical protein